MLEATFSHSFSAAGALLVAVGWVGGLALAVVLALRRTIGATAETAYTQIPNRGIDERRTAA